MFDPDIGMGCCIGCVGCGLGISLIADWSAVFVCAFMFCVYGIATFISVLVRRYRIVRRTPEPEERS